MEENAGAKEYPESWDEHEQASAESERRIKLKDGQSCRVHIISGPLTYREMYVELGKDVATGKAKKKRITVPFAAQLPGWKLKVQYLCEVVLLDGAGKGTHKLLQFGKQIADGLAEVKKVWGSTRTPDLVVSRKGSGQMDTEYSVTAAPATMDPKNVAVEFNLELEAGFSKKEDIDSLPKPTASPEGSVISKITHAQVDFVDGLCKAKEMDARGLSALLSRKFGKIGVGELTSTEASVLIETLQSM